MRRCQARGGVGLDRSLVLAIADAAAGAAMAASGAAQVFACFAHTATTLAAATAIAPGSMPATGASPMAQNTRPSQKPDRIRKTMQRSA